MSAAVSSHTHPGATIYSAFLEVARQNSERIAFKAEGGRGRSYTYGEVRTIVGQLSSSLSRAEYTKRIEIGLLSENRPEWGIAYLTILAAGRTVVPIDANLKENEISYIITHAGLDVIFSSGRFEETLRKLHPQFRILSFENDSSNSWSGMAKGERSTGKSHDAGTAVLIFTSGTTGTPKAVELTHRNILANLDGIASGIKFDHNDIFLSVLPLHHTFEATSSRLRVGADHLPSRHRAGVSRSGRAQALA